MKNRTRTLLARCFVPGLIGLMIAPAVLPVEQAVAATTDPISLSYSKVDNTIGKIQVTFGTGTQSVLLPNGTKVFSSTSIQVKENGTYDFVAYDSNGKPTQTHLTVSGLDVDPASLTIAHGLYVKLHVDAFDTISQVESYRYKLDNASTWSAWTPHKETNSHEIKIPVTASTESFMEERAVQVEVRDHAGNIATTQTSFRVDHYYPEIEPFTETIYTKTGRISIPLVTNSYFKNPDKLIIEEGTKVDTRDLTNVNHKETLLERRPNQYKADWGNDITYEVEKTQGARDIELTVVKSYVDFKGNRTELPSNKSTKHVINVVYDTEKPTGTVIIQADDKNEVLSHEVTLNLKFTDETSGIAEVKVFEEGTNKEYYLTPEEIKSGDFTLPWVLSLGKNGQVSMKVTDKTGNSEIFQSNKVTVSNIQVSGFELTNVVNPAVTDFPSQGYKWQFDGNNVHMVAGGNFSFNTYYDLGFVDSNRFIVSGTYKVMMISEGETVYESEAIPYKQGFDENNLFGDAGLTTTYTIPTVDKNGKPFKDGTKVYLSSTLERLEKVGGKKLTATFEAPGSDGNLIGVIGHYDGAMSIDDMVRFNEKN